MLFALTWFAAGAPALAQTKPFELASGAWVHIEGSVDERGAFSPRLIQVQSPLSKPLVRGAITTSEHGGRRLTLLGFAIETDSATTIYRGAARAAASFGELTPGVLVEAKVVRRGKRLVATRIRIEDAAASDGAASIDAPVDHVDLTTARLILLGAPLTVSADTAIVGERHDAALPQVTTDRLRRDDDEQHVEPVKIGDAVTVGGRIETTLVDRADFDLTDARPDRNERVDSQLQLLATGAWSPTFESYARLATSQRIPVFDQRGPASLRSDIRVEEMYLAIHDPGGLRMTAQVGRQRFRDAREWFFDEYLDGIRLATDLGQWRVDLAATRGLFPPGEDDLEPRDATHLIASATTRLRTTAVNAFILYRRGDRSGATPTWIGATASGRLAANAKYWSLVSIRRGRAGSVRLRGWAADLGTTWQVSARGRSSLTVAFATASGDNRPDDGVDGAFHQTALNDNKARFGGLKRVASYGEALRPELSALSIFTIGGSAMPLPKGSVELMYHRYVRMSRTGWVGARAVGTVADGDSRNLGDEIDAVVVSQAIRGIDLSLVVGVFRPGAAFPHGRSPAMVWRPQIRLYF